MGEFSELVGPDRQRRVRFAASLTIGRHPSNDLQLEAPEISSRHAVLEWIEGEWRLRDLGSRNGTSLNGRRISGSNGVHEGDVLRFAGGGAWRVRRLASRPPARPPVQQPIATDS